jgi:EmrB/QacA subfamily drug resistance transporter
MSPQAGILIVAVIARVVGASIAAVALWHVRERRNADAVRDLWERLVALGERNPEVYDLIMSGTPFTSERLATASPQTRVDVETALRLCEALGTLARRPTTDRETLFALWQPDRAWRSLQPLIERARQTDPYAYARLEQAIAVQARHARLRARAIQGDFRRTVLVTIAVGLAVLIYALDLTIVASALPTIANDLHGLTLYGWVFSAYSIAATATALLYGRLADLAGRRQLFLIAMMGFLTGSMLCGLAQSMPELVAFRALQGLFGGATFPLAVGIIADTYPIERRAQGFAIVPTVFGVASVLGPLAGGFLADTVGWRWIFFVNVPIVAAAVLLLLRTYRVPAIHGHLHLRDLDPSGVATLFGGLVLLLAALTAGGKDFDWGSWQEITMLAVAFLLLASFFSIERRSLRPLLPLRILRHRGLGGALLTIALLGWITNSLILFVPQLAQGVLGATARGAGAALIPLMFTWSLTANMSVRLGQRFGFRRVALLGTPAIVLGLIWLQFVGLGDSVWSIVPPLLLVGLGAGMINPNMMVLAQSSLSDRDQALAGGLGNVAMSLSAATAAAALSALQLGLLAVHAGTDVAAPAELLTQQGRGLLASAYGFQWLSFLQQALNASLHDVFAVGFVPIAFMVLWLLLVVPSNSLARQIRLPPLRPAPQPAGKPATPAPEATTPHPHVGE